MTSRFLMSVAAAALIAGSGFAFAQGAGGAGGAGGGAAGGGGPPTTQQSPAPSGGAMNRDAGESKGTKGAQTNEKMAPEGGKSQRAQDRANEKMAPEGGKNQRAQDTKPGMKGEKSAQDSMKGEKSKSMTTETQDKGAVGRDKSQTTGQAGAAAKLSTEQRTQITSVIKQQSVQPATNVNFSIAVGTRVPRSGLTFHPLPAQVVTIYPEWRGYEFILVRDQIVVINPRTLAIVAVLDA
jgi:hypothetical protein